MEGPLECSRGKIPAARNLLISLLPAGTEL